MPYYSPNIKVKQESKPAGLPQLAGAEGAGRSTDRSKYDYMMKLPAPYGYPEASDALHRKKPPIAPMNPPAAPQPGQPATPQNPTVGVPPTAPPQTAAPDPNAPAPVPVQEYDPAGFPLVKDRGDTWSRYYDGSTVNYSSGNWAYTPLVRAQLYPEMQAVWDQIPDSWKVDLAGRAKVPGGMNFVLRYFDAVLRGNSAQARDIYGQSGDYRDQYSQGNRQQAQPTPVEYRNAPYYQG